VKISLGVVHGDKIDAWFFHSVMGLLTSHHGQYEFMDHVCVRSGPLLAQGRGQLVGSFLTNTTSDALLMIDSDQYATPDVIYSHADVFRRTREQHPEVGIVAGLTYIATTPQDADILYPNIWQIGQHPLQMSQMTTYPKDTLIEVGAMGCSNMMIAREVLQQFADQNVNPFHHKSIVDYQLLVDGIATLDDRVKRAEVAQRTVEEADQFGEDLSFCYRVRQNGWKITCHTGIIYEHSKAILLNETMYDAAVARHTTKEPV
jgi:hypothetical protein